MGGRRESGSDLDRSCIVGVGVNSAITVRLQCDYSAMTCIAPPSKGAPQRTPSRVRRAAPICHFIRTASSKFANFSHSRTAKKTRAKFQSCQRL